VLKKSLTPPALSDMRFYDSYQSRAVRDELKTPVRLAPWLQMVHRAKSVSPHWPSNHRRSAMSAASRFTRGHSRFGNRPALSLKTKIFPGQSSEGIGAVS
jgi:hypothetical protein